MIIFRTPHFVVQMSSVNVLIGGLFVSPQCMYKTQVYMVKGSCQKVEIGYNRTERERESEKKRKKQIRLSQDVHKLDSQS